ncbi:MAG: hypothetical protein FJ102_07670 [Deltaproteobacteria bacterium]|nr:hypothetical protein [Deltaproteobacteria bacterium]
MAAEKPATAITAACGEHLVAARLAGMGFVVALTRGGSPAADLLVTDVSGTRTIPVQVKTSRWARRVYKRKPDRNHAEWLVGGRRPPEGSDIVYACVSLNGWPQASALPEIFLVPASRVRWQVDYAAERGHKWVLLWIPESEFEMYRERWDHISGLLAPVLEAPAGGDSSPLSTEFLGPDGPAVETNE